MAHGPENPQGRIGDRPLRLIPGDRKSPLKPKRPCSKCGRKFQPTERRRLLCLTCFNNA